MQTKRDLQIRVHLSQFGMPPVRTVWIRATSDNEVIGKVCETRVQFNGKTATATAAVRHCLADACVKRHLVTWRWSVRIGRGDWEELVPTQHVVYTVVRRPHAPWGRKRSQLIEIPWLEALDLACEWAIGASNVEEVCERVTKEVWRSSILEYSPTFMRYVEEYPGCIWPKSFSWFQCGEFLRFVKHAKELSQQSQAIEPATVDCTDVATIVCTFANLLGADLYQDRLRGPRLKKGARKPIVMVDVKGIGWPDYKKPDAFEHHDVAWSGPLGQSRLIWDACFSVVQDNQETLPISRALADYRVLMTGDDDPKKLASDRPWGKRRPVMDMRHRRSHSVTVPALDTLELPGWTSTPITARQATPDRTRVSSHWRRRDDPDERLVIEMFEVFRTPKSVRELYKAWVSSQLQVPVKEKKPPICGDLDYVYEIDPLTQTTFYSWKGTRILRVASTGRKPVFNMLSVVKDLTPQIWSLKKRSVEPTSA